MRWNSDFMRNFFLSSLVVLLTVGVAAAADFTLSSGAVTWDCTKTYNNVVINGTATIFMGTGCGGTLQINASVSFLLDTNAVIDGVEIGGAGGAGGAGGSYGSGGSGGSGTGAGGAGGAGEYSHGAGGGGGAASYGGLGYLGVCGSCFPRGVGGYWGQGGGNYGQRGNTYGNETDMTYPAGSGGGGGGGGAYSSVYTGQPGQPGGGGIRINSPLITIHGTINVNGLTGGAGGAGYHSGGGGGGASGGSIVLNGTGGIVNLSNSHLYAKGGGGGAAGAGSGGSSGAGGGGGRIKIFSNQINTNNSIILVTGGGSSSGVGGAGTISSVNTQYPGIGNIVFDSNFYDLYTRANITVYLYSPSYGYFTYHYKLLNPSNTITNTGEIGSSASFPYQDITQSLSPIGNWTVILYAKRANATFNLSSATMTVIPPGVGVGIIYYNSSTYPLFAYGNVTYTLTSPNLIDWSYFIEQLNPSGVLIEYGQIYNSNHSISTYSFNSVGNWTIKLYACGSGNCNTNRVDLDSNTTLITGSLPLSASSQIVRETSVKSWGLQGLFFVVLIIILLMIVSFNKKK